MKGQHLAVESVLTLAMGLTLAIGTIGIFSSYQDQVKKSTTDIEVETVEYRLKTSVYSLKNSDEATKKIEIPDDISGMEYTVALDNGIRIVTPDSEHVSRLDNLNSYEMQGSTQGGTVTLYKTGNQYTLRSN